MDSRSRQLRVNILDMLQAGGQGHLGPAASLVEILRVLYDRVLKVNPVDAGWEGRDRLILSKGHGCLALYSILYDKGLFDRETLVSYGGIDSPLGGHPERGCLPGVEASTGALGHGLPIGVGMALGLRIKEASSRVFVVMGDGELNEGSVWEAAAHAAKHRLENLTIIVDANGQQCFGSSSDVLPFEPLGDKWRSFGCNVVEINGHDVDALGEAFTAVASNKGPSVVICRTVKGKGFGPAEGNPRWHYVKGLSEAEYQGLREALT